MCASAVQSWWTHARTLGMSKGRLSCSCSFTASARLPESQCSMKMCSVDEFSSAGSSASLADVAPESVVLAEADKVEEVAKGGVEAPAERDPATSKKVLAWLWKKARGDQRYAALGVLGAAIAGLTQPLVGFLMAEFIATRGVLGARRGELLGARRGERVTQVAFFNTDRGDMRREARFWALMFVALAGGGGIGEL